MVHRRGLFLVFAIAVPLLAAHLPAQADALRKVEKATKPSHTSSHSSSSSTSSHSSSSAHPSAGRSAGGGGSGYVYYEEHGDTDCRQSQSVGCGFAWLTFSLIAFPWTLPRMFDHSQRDLYAPYPFADGPGVLRTNGDPTAVAPPAATRRATLDVAAESGYMLEGAVPASISLRARLPRRFELSATVSLLSDVYEQPVERATMARAHLIYRHAQMRRVDFRTGVGARMFLLDSPRVGVDFFYGIDGYFARRGIVRIDLHAGTLGGAGFGQVRATVGAMVSRLELYAGYDHTALFGREHATLGGPVAGVRTWF